jgi:hypothetical protein
VSSFTKFLSSLDRERERKESRGIESLHRAERILYFTQCRTHHRAMAWSNRNDERNITKVSHRSRSVSLRNFHTHLGEERESKDKKKKKKWNFRSNSNSTPEDIAERVSCRKIAEYPIIIHCVRNKSEISTEKES